ncbi:MAG: hypothetical protein QXN59_02570 [Candidatus Micrarchaeaceae archaeon]
MCCPDVLRIYSLLRKRFGFQNWWPGDTADEILIGAVLTQQTSWNNVEKALRNLKAAGALSVEAVSAIGIGRLERLIKPSGFYRQKARRLKSLCSKIMSYGSLEGFFSMPIGELRRELLGLSGIGPETADSIILYAAGKPSFVIDAYTRRAMERICGVGASESYEELQEYFSSRIRRSTKLYKDMHAQFVELCKHYCKKSEPICAECPLRRYCSFGRARLGRAKNGAAHPE